LWGFGGEGERKMATEKGNWKKGTRKKNGLDVVLWHSGDDGRKIS